MRDIGRVVRLQVQRDSLKKGERPERYYDPAAIVAVPALRLAAGGVWGLDGAIELVDVHNAAHPGSKNRGDNGISVNFTGHYRRMQERFGPHLAFGRAGENILVEYEGTASLAELAGGLLVEDARGELARLDGARVAEPCEPFTTFALALGERPAAAVMKEALQFLGEGRRGFYLGLGGEAREIRLGSRVFAA
jgi:hypothetical protein